MPLTGQFAPFFRFFFYSLLFSSLLTLIFKFGVVFLQETQNAVFLAQGALCK
jgi:hypothetical protein